MKKRYLWLIAAGWLFSGMAQALTLDEAKQQGRVGETLSGYIAPVKQDAETQALVKKSMPGVPRNTNRWPPAIILPSMKLRGWPGRSW